MHPNKPDDPGIPQYPKYLLPASKYQTAQDPRGFVSVPQQVRAVLAAQEAQTKQYAYGFNVEADCQYYWGLNAGKNILEVLFKQKNVMWVTLSCEIIKNALFWPKLERSRWVFFADFGHFTCITDLLRYSL